MNNNEEIKEVEMKLAQAKQMVLSSQKKKEMNKRKSDKRLECKKIGQVQTATAPHECASQGQRIYSTLTQRMWDSCIKCGSPSILRFK